MLGDLYWIGLRITIGEWRIFSSGITFVSSAAIPNCEIWSNEELPIVPKASGDPEPQGICERFAVPHSVAALFRKLSISACISASGVPAI